MGLIIIDWPWQGKDGQVTQCGKLKFPQESLSIWLRELEVSMKTAGLPYIHHLYLRSLTLYSGSPRTGLFSHFQ